MVPRVDNSGCEDGRIICRPQNANHWTLISIEPATADVGYWHLADIPIALTNVRFQGQSRHQMLNASLSAFDQFPKLRHPNLLAGKTGASALDRSIASMGEGGVFENRKPRICTAAAAQKLWRGPFSPWRRWRQDAARRSWDNAG
jgi:hypothetical protein